MKAGISNFKEHRQIPREKLSLSVNQEILHPFWNLKLYQCATSACTFSIHYHCAKSLFNLSTLLQYATSLCSFIIQPQHATSIRKIIMQLQFDTMSVCSFTLQLLTHDNCPKTSGRWFTILQVLLVLSILPSTRTQVTFKMTKCCEWTAKRADP